MAASDPLGTGGGAGPAVFLPDGRELSHGELNRAVDRVARLLDRRGKSLVLCPGDRDLATVLGYLGALRAGHTVAFLPGTPEVLAAYRPEFVLTDPRAGEHPGDGYRRSDPHDPDVAVFARTGGADAPEIHPDTAVLLATSGTTGSPKTVRLSYEGLAGNTDAVVAALGVDAAERAATTLPIRHAYGLSVLNTHLRAGAAVLLVDERPMSLRMWELMARFAVTSFAAVPATYAAFGARHAELLARTAIRTMTQAGGRLPDELVLRSHRMMERRGGRFFVMYGQTEATARISCLHPDELPARLGSVGRPVPGGQIEIVPAGGHLTASEDEGEVHYRGPGVMLGYGTGRADLAGGAETTSLATGDLGRVRDGFLYLTGRMKRIVKVFGTRVSLDDLERLVERAGHPLAIVADADEVVHLFGAGDPAVHELQRRELRTRLGVGGRHVVVHRVSRLPTTPRGKVDYAALSSAATSRSA